MKKDAQYAAPALDKGLDIIEYLSATGIPQSQTEIAQALDRGSSELYRMLARLEARGYVHRDAVSGKYHLSLKLYHLSHTHSPVDALRRLAMYPMHELASKTGHPVHLCVLDHDALMVVLQERGPNVVTLSIEEGSRFPLLTTTSGNVMLASLRDEERRSLLARLQEFQEWKKSRRDEFIAQLEMIGRQGYHSASSQLTQGVSDIAARIGTPGAPVVATIAISYVSSLLGRSIDPVELVHATVATAREIGRASGLGT